MMMAAVVFVGGGLGALARYGAGALVGRAAGTAFPWATLSVNLLGALVIGLITAVLALKTNISPNVRLFAVTGFLGGFTTFSAFSLESALMYMRGDYAALAAYVTLSVIGTVALVLLAQYIVRTPL